MLSPEEQQLLDGIEQRMRTENPSFARRFDVHLARGRQQRLAEARLFLLVLLGAVVLSTGVATMSFDPIIGWLIAALGCAVLLCVVGTARRHSPGPARPPSS